MNNFGQGIDFNIRGIGKAEHNSQTTTGVITYRDGVATFPGYYTAEPYYDLARVEILRGPQGTFVGENATGGAVFVTSQDPVINGGHTGYISAQAGNYGDFGAQGAINLPAGDKFAARVAFNAEKRDSFYDITGPYTGDDGVQDRQLASRHAVGAERPPLVQLQGRLQLPGSVGLSVRSGPRHQRSVRHHRQRRLPRARPLRPRGAQGRLRIRQRHDAAFGLGLPAGPDRIPHRSRRHHGTLPHAATGSSATSRRRRSTRRRSTSSPRMPTSSSGSSAPTTSTTRATSPRTAASTSACRRRSSICSTAPTPRDHGLLRPGQLRHAGRLRAAARRALLGSQHHANDINVNQYGTAAHAAAGGEVHQHLRQGDAELHGQRAQLPVRLRRHRLPAGRSERTGRASACRRRSTKRRSRTTRSAGRPAGPTAGCARSSTRTTTTTTTSR